MICSLLFILVGVALALNSTLSPPINTTDRDINGSSDKILRVSGLGLRRDLSQGSCANLRVSYPRDSDEQRSSSTCAFPIKMKHSNWAVHLRRNFNTSIDTDWLSLFQDNSFIRQPWCLRFKVDYIIQEDIGLAEIRIVVVCGARRMHALRIIVDSYDSTATKVFEFNDQNHILQGNCSDMVDVMLKLTVNSKLRILRNSPYSFLVLGAESNDVRFSESRCDCSGFERFERRLSWCGGAIFRDKFFGKRFYVIMSVLLGTGLLVTISLSACNLIQNPAR